MEKISTKEQFKIWGHVAANSFGGPAGQIAVIHKLVVDERKLISEERFLYALNFCMLLPGPEAQQLATYMGWLIDRWRGGLIAGGLFILPGFLSILVLSYIYVIYNDLPFVQGIFYGMKPAIIAVVAAALYRLSMKSLKNSFYWMVAIFSFVSLFFINISFPIIVISSGVIGAFYGKFFAPHEFVSEVKAVFPQYDKTLKTLLLWLGIWFLPVVLVLLIFGKGSTFHELNLFFSKMSLLTFGGAYGALSYVSDKAVEVYGWLQGAEMLDGLALAEITPGPLIQAVQFVGFMGSYRFPDISSPHFAALIGSILTTWMTFAPCFLWIFTFAPYVEFIRGQKVFTDSLQAITAAVVGVIFNLSIWFVFKALFLRSGQIEFSILKFDYPIFSSLDPYASGICFIALILQFKFKKGLFLILGTSTILGILIRLFFFNHLV